MILIIYKITLILWKYKNISLLLKLLIIYADELEKKQQL